MTRAFTVTGFGLFVAGLVALVGGLLALDLTPLVLGGLLVGLGGVLLLLTRLERRLAAALPALEALSKTAHYLSLKESAYASGPGLPEPKPQPGPGLRSGPSVPVEAHPAGGDGAAARP